MTDAIPEIEAAWPSAVEDAELSRPAAYWVFDGASRQPDGEPAWCYGEAGIYEDPDSQSVREELDRALEAGRHRVAVWSGERSAPILVALLRHELEHAKQMEVIGRDLSRLWTLADAILRLHPDAPTLRGATLYQAIPIELEANAAAARFMRTYLSRRAHAALLTEEGIRHRSLLTQESEDPPEGLERRMVQILIDHRDLCDRWAGSSPPPFQAYLPASSSGHLERHREPVTV